MFIQMSMHIKAVPQQVRLVSPPFPQALELRLIEVIRQYRFVIRMRALLDDDPRSLSRTQTTNVRETLFCDNNIKIMLGLVNVCTHGYDAADTCRIGLGRAGRRCVHDGVLGGAEEVGAATEAVEHAGAHHAGRVCVCVYIYFDGGVHADDTQTTDDLGRIRDLLRAEEQLRSILLPVIVETLEAVGREANRCCRREIKIPRVE